MYDNKEDMLFLYTSSALGEFAGYEKKGWTLCSIKASIY
jgi:hypothetical protein